MNAAVGAWERRARALDPHVAHVARELFAAAQDVLTVGVRAALEPCATTFVEEPAQAASSGQEFDGALWLLAAQAVKRAPLRGRETAQHTDPGAGETSKRTVASASELGNGSPRAGLAMLRPLLRPGAPVLLVAPSRPPALAQLRALLSRERAAQRPSIESLFEAVLLAGLCAPCVHTDHPGWLTVSACLPSACSTLDAFFAQPAPAPHR